MNITYTRQTALAIIRAVRNRNDGARKLSKRCNLTMPSPEPYARWSRKRIDPVNLLPMLDVPSGLPISTAAPSHAARLRMKDISCISYEAELPQGSFIDLGNGVAISSPELLFIEMGSSLALPQHIMLGHELCGSFTRDAARPRSGQVRMGVPPVTSVGKIKAFLDASRNIRERKRAYRALEYLSDNAWSPTESVVATMACLPLDEFGYGLSPVTLNERIETPKELLQTTDKESRVPDILFDGTPVGINYDGAVHLDLSSIVNASMALAARPGESALFRELQEALTQVRAKVVDDIMRNRELAADGYIVFPVVKEDLFGKDGLDRVMLQVIQCIEERTGLDLSRQRRAIALPLAKQRRRELLRTMLPKKRLDIGESPHALSDEDVTYEFIAGI